MDLKTLERMTVVKLRDEALKIPDLSGVRGMSKEELIRALAKAHGFDLSGRRRGGGARTELKRQIRELRSQISELIRAKQSAGLKRLRRHVKRLKAQTRRLARKAAATATPSGESSASPSPG
jgi:hypothetical protein